MSKKALLLAMALTFAVGATAAYADGGETDHIVQVYNEDAGSWVPSYNDGRLNGTHIMAPFAVFYSHDEALVENDDGEWVWTEVVCGIEIWAIDANSNGQLVLYADEADLATALSASSDVVVAAANGYSISYSPCQCIPSTSPQFAPPSRQTCNNW